MTPFLLLFSGGCHMMNNDDALRDMVWMLNGVPVGATNRIIGKNLATYTDLLYVIN